jgi:hypothetical protein
MARRLTITIVHPGLFSLRVFVFVGVLEFSRAIFWRALCETLQLGPWEWILLISWLAATLWLTCPHFEWERS